MTTAERREKIYFPLPLDMRSVYGQRGVVTLSPFKFWSHRYKKWIEVPVGTYSNFGSVPSIIPPLIAPRVGKIKEGYIIHDYLYQHKGNMPNGDYYTKHQADIILYDAMDILGVNAFRRGVILAGVKANLIAKYKWGTPE